MLSNIYFHQFAMLTTTDSLAYLGAPGTALRQFFGPKMRSELKTILSVPVISSYV